MTNISYKHTLLKNIIIIILVLLQGSPFLAGYRVTPDQISAHYTVLGGFNEVIAHSIESLFSSGRACIFFHPLFCYAELLSDYFIFRLLFIAIYFFSLIIFANYWSKLIRADVFSLMVLLLVSLQILDYNNLLPNSYNIAFTLPLFLLLCARFASLMLDDALSQVSKTWVFVLSATCITSYLISDYILIFGASLLIMEYLLAFTRLEGGMKIRINALIRRKKTFFDLFPITLAGLIYYSWRHLFPPSYGGITLAKHYDPLLIFQTALTHALGGLSLARSDLYGLDLSFDFLPVEYILLLFCIFLSSAILAAASIYRLRGLDKAKYIIPCCLFLTFFVTLPLALTPKYQQLQTENMPAYVDSRFAYFWVVAGISSLACLTGSFFGAGKRRIILSGFFGLFVGAASAFSYYHNVDMSQVMLDHAAVWDRARSIASAPNASILLQDGKLTASIDPFSLVTVHPEFDSQSYWQRYLSWYGQHKEDVLLHWNPRISPPLPVNLKPGIVYTIAELPRRFFGSSGWFLLKNRVAYSIGSRAVVTFRTDQIMKSATLAFTASAYLAPGETQKTAEIWLNGKLLQSLTLGNEPSVIKLAIPGDLLQGDLANFEFSVQQPASPADYGSQDNRRLGFGLWNILLVPQ